MAEKLERDIPPDLTSYRDDLLRTAVVFLHATLEDFLRYVGALNLPHASAESLDRIPLVGLRDPMRPEKFLLGQLAMHRGKTVEALIEESVTNHLERTSYSDSNDVARLLSAVGIKSERIEAYYGDLSSLMSRRHAIVHRADLGDQLNDQGERLPSAISIASVRRWNEVVLEFMSAVIAVGVEKRVAPSPEPDEKSE